MALILCLCALLCGCNDLTPEEREEQRLIEIEYREIGKELITKSLADKYGEVPAINKLKVLENRTPMFGYQTGTYRSVVVGTARIDEESFDVQVSWDEENQEDFYCCDSKEKDDVIADLDAYFYSIYEALPYKKYYGVFAAIGDYDGAFGRDEGMLEEKYSGNIEDKYLVVESEKSEYWENDLIDAGDFLYKGNVADPSSLVDNDCGLTLSLWVNYSYESIDNYEIVSDWYHASDNSPVVLYIKENCLDFKSSNYYLLTYREREDGTCDYWFDTIDHDSGYLLCDTSYYDGESWFAICALERSRRIFS